MSLTPLKSVTIPAEYISCTGRVKNFKPRTQGKALGNSLIKFGKSRGYISSSGTCAMCEAECSELHWHHDSYDRPEVVIPLCGACHRKRHTELGWGNAPKGWRKDAVSRQGAFVRARRISGQCIRCGSGVTTGKARCEPCGERAYEMARAYRAKKRKTPNPKPKKAA